MARLLPLLCVLALLVGAAPAAWAEEVFVLDNGNMVRGRIIRQDAEHVVVRLAGFVEENRITLRTSEIVRQYTSVDPLRRPGPGPMVEDQVMPAALAPSSYDGVPRTVLLAPDLIGREGAEPTPGLPVGDVDLASEGFFGRLQRVAALAAPGTLEGQVLIGILLLIVMSVLVAGGTRLLGMKAASLHASTSLGLLLGVFLATDVLWSEALLRADRALWVLPLQAVIWLGVARSTLDAPMSRTIPLLALVLFAAVCCAFATGSLLVAA